MEWLKIIVIVTSIFVVRYFLVSGLAALLIEGRFSAVLSRFRIQKRDIKPADLKREFWYSMSTLVIFGLIYSVAFHPAVRPYTKIYSEASQHGYLWWAVSFFVLVAIHDTYFYWAHRLMHHPLIFKRVHRVHHMSTNPSALASHAFHPSEAVLEIIWMLPVFLLIPLHTGVLFEFGLFSILVNTIGHSGLEVQPAHWAQHPILKWINTSTKHNDHHLYPTQYGNFGLYTSVWDRLMGTVIEPQKIKSKVQRENSAQQHIV